MTHLLASLFGSLHCQEKVHIFTILDWIDRLEAFDSNALAALNLEELNSIQEEKQIFLNKIGYDQKNLSNMVMFGKRFNPKVQELTTEEGLLSLMNEMANKFLIENPNFRIDVFKTGIEKKNTAPAHSRVPMLAN